MTVATEGRVPADTLPHRLLLIRHEKGWSQREAAMACGVTYGEWQSMESGREARGLGEKVRKIAETTGYNRYWIMWGGPLAPQTPPDGGGKLPHLDSNQEPFGYVVSQESPKQSLSVVSDSLRRVTTFRSAA